MPSCRRFAAQQSSAATTVTQETAKESIEVSFKTKNLCKMPVNLPDGLRTRCDPGPVGPESEGRAEGNEPGLAQCVSLHTLHNSGCSGMTRIIDPNPNLDLNLDHSPAPELWLLARSPDPEPEPN